MKVNKYDILEFSKVYKRVMDIEVCLKTRFFTAMQTIATGKEFSRLTKALENPLIIKKTKYSQTIKTKNKELKINKINNLISSKEPEQKKLKKLLKLLYLRDLLQVVTEYKYLSGNKDFKNCLFCGPVNLDIVKKHASQLADLRNIIMHFNIDDYCSKKADYIIALAFWESILHCRNHFIHQLPPITPTTKNILSQIKVNYPEIFEKNDREIVDIYDDIAFINGLPVEKLPQYWSIGRQIYEIKRKDR